MKVNLLKSPFFKRRNEIPVEELETISCDNCNFEFKGHFCPNCGQEVAEFNRPFGFIIYDFAGNFFAFDTRFFQTFKYLLIRPGFLAVEFFKGRRTRYSPPFRTFVFLSFILFILLQYITERGLDKNLQSNVIKTSSNTITHPDSIDEVSKRVYSEIRVSMNDMPASVVDMEEELSDSALSESDLDIDFSVLNSGNIRDNLNIMADQIEDQLHKTTDPEMRKKYSTYIVMCRAPEIAISTIMKYLSWMFFLLLPLFALMLKLFYIRRKQLYVKHLIFSIYLHSYLFFILILVACLSLLSMDVLTLVSLALFITLPVYFLIAMHTFYGQNYLKVFFKFSAISFIYMIILTSGVTYIFIKSVGII
ncbi:MAG: DUF3667 domain-containing protein [Verrucomicrobia bacterium]|nr:DUF3667 domain-containing protein [Prolixibacteraceae bacterium]